MVFFFASAISVPPHGTTGASGDPSTARERKKKPLPGASQSQAASTSKPPVMATGNPRVVFRWCWMVEWGLGMRRISCQPIPDRLSCTMRIRVKVPTAVFAYFFRTAFAPLQPRPAVTHHASFGEGRYMNGKGFGRVDVRMYNTENRCELGISVGRGTTAALLFRGGKPARLPVCPWIRAGDQTHDTSTLGRLGRRS